MKRKYDSPKLELLSIKSKEKIAFEVKPSYDGSEDDWSGWVE